MEQPRIIRREQVYRYWSCTQLSQERALLAPVNSAWHFPPLAEVQSRSRLQFQSHLKPADAPAGQAYGNIRQSTPEAAG
jgi:hypothetical protein